MTRAAPQPNDDAREAAAEPPPIERIETRPDAFAEMWERVRPALSALLVRRFRASLETSLRALFDAELDDFLQETAIAVLANHGRFESRGPGSLLAWMSTVAVRVTHDRVDYWRALKRHPRATVRIAPDPGGGLDELVGRSPDPPSEAAVRETRDRIRQALAELSERHQQIVTLRFFVGASWQEIADMIGAPSGDAVAMECVRRVLPAMAARIARGDGSPLPGGERTP